MTINVARQHGSTTMDNVFDTGLTFGQFFLGNNFFHSVGVFIYLTWGIINKITMYPVGGIYLWTTLPVSNKSPPLQNPINIWWDRMLGGGPRPFNMWTEYLAKGDALLPLLKRYILNFSFSQMWPGTVQHRGDAYLLSWPPNPKKNSFLFSDQHWWQALWFMMDLHRGDIYYYFLNKGIVKNRLLSFFALHIF